MFKVLIADDNFEDRELLKLEINQSLGSQTESIKFYEASNVKKARELLKNIQIDLLTLDIEFDRLSEGIEVLPEIFENYPTLSIIVISGKLNKNEVTEQLFQFTKDNVLKGKRWIRHFDVLDKKDDKSEALKQVYSFVFKQKEAADNVKDLFILAESYLEKEEIDKCIDVYHRIQNVAPGEMESGENIKILSNSIMPDHVLQYMRSGDKIVGSLLLGHFIEIRLKSYTRKRLGRAFATLSDCLKALDNSRKIKPFKRELFNKMMRLRNKAIHRPSSISEESVQSVVEDLKFLEAKL